MTLKKIISGIIVLILILITSVYWLIPFQKIEFVLEGENSNFSLYNLNSQAQFYQNMRFQNKDISYRIEDCPLKKQEDMRLAFDIIENKTIIKFFSTSNNEDIIINCDSKNKIEEGLFIAGEGGPTNITQNKNFNIIKKGSIILRKDSLCNTPNIALHELLHVLGFNHSENQNNIMYPITSCKQDLGDIPNIIDNIYSINNYSDLEIENVSAVMNGKYLNANISIRNNGLAPSENFKITIYIDESKIKEISADILLAGEGIGITLTNVWVAKLNIKEIDFIIEGNFIELNKENNKKVLQIKT